MKAWIKKLVGQPALARLAAARLSECGLIVAYHDIGPDDGPGSWLRVRQSEFDRQLRWLGALGRFITPDELPEVGTLDTSSDAGAGTTARAGHPRSLRILVTFDDGYANHFRLARPVLERHGVPALFFVSTWHAATGEPFWFDRVSVPIQADARAELDLRDLGLSLYRFHPEDGIRRWGDVQRLLEDIKALGNPGQPAVDRVVARCEQESGARGRAALADCRPLGREEIGAMAAGGLGRFGSHAHRHEILTLLDPAGLARTLQESREFLARALSAPPLDLAYPNGDADERVRAAAAAAAGFRRGYTVEAGIVRPGTGALRLPRLLIGGYDTLEVLRFKLNRVLLRAAAGRGGDLGVRERRPAPIPDRSAE